MKSRPTVVMESLWVWPFPAKMGSSSGCELGSSINNNVIILGWRACYVTFYFKMSRLVLTIVMAMPWRQSHNSRDIAWEGHDCRRDATTALFECSVMEMSTTTRWSCSCSLLCFNAVFSYTHLLCRLSLSMHILLLLRANILENKQAFFIIFCSSIIPF